jgi:ankyrin repeat protein
VPISFTAPFRDCTNVVGIDLRSLRPKATAIQTFGTSEFATTFLRDIASYTATTTRVRDRVPYIQPRISLLAFQSLLPEETSQEQCHYNLNLVATNAMLETNFTQILVFSITNGFAGLRDMPIAGVFKFLTRYGHVNAVFGQILKANPSYVAKSLAENLFKVTIEAQESDVVMQLLKTSFVQVDRVICWVDGQKMTAAERAAQLRDLKTLNVLINAGADVNKTFAVVPWRGGVLRQLIVNIRRGETIPDVIRIIPFLLRAGAKVYAKMLMYVIGVLRHSQLALCLLPSLLPTHDTDLISNGTLWLITHELKQEAACKATQQILQDCDIRHKYRCVQDFTTEVEWALVESAKRGHLQVVQMLLPHSSNLNSVISASIRSRKRDIVKKVLDMSPDFTSPAHSITRERQDNRELIIWGIIYPEELPATHYPHTEEFDRSSRTSYFDEKTTPLAEAISTESDDFIRICETAGAFGHLHLSGHFEAALAAAATTGNILYIRKLLKHVPSPHPRDMSPALLYSIQNGHYDISLELISRGADVRYRNHYFMLLAALKQRNVPIVAAILDSGESSSGLDEYELIDEAMSWCDRDIISDLHYSFPCAQAREYRCSYESIVDNDEGFWNFLNFSIELGVLDISTLTAWFEEPIKYGNTKMIMRLIDLGAVPFGEKLYTLAVQHHPEILGILLETLPKTVIPVSSFRKHSAVHMAVTLGLGGLGSLEVLLSSKVVDFRMFWEDDSTPLGLAIGKALQFKGEFPIVKRLLEAGCDPNSVVCVRGIYHKCNMTALLIAIQTKSIDLVKLLINSGAEIDTQAKRGLTRTPLQLAAELGCLEMVKLLISKGADVNASPVPRGGGTALQLAAISGNCNIVAELLSQGANPCVPPSCVRGRWPIEGAAEHGRLDMIEYLLKVGIHDAEKCARAMELARENGHMGCYDLLAKHVENRNADGQDDRTNLAWTI